MINSIIRHHFFFRFSSVCILFFGIFFSFTALAAAPPLKGGSYIEGFNTQADYRQVTTLNEFTLLVYRERWKNIRYEHLITQMNHFKGVSSSPALRESWRDVLLGDFTDLRIRNGEEQNTLMAKRLELLIKLGLYDEAVRLYNEAAKIKPVPDIIATQGVNALALSGSADGACLEVYMAANHLHSAEWKKDQALCAIYFGERELAKTLYDAVKENSGSGFKAVYQMLNRRDNKAIQVGIPPLWRTLLLSQGATVTAKALAQADAITLASLAINKHVPLSVRLTAAGRAANMGTFDADQLRKLYEATHPENKGLDAIIADAKNGKKLTQADYYAAARFTFDGKDRAIIVKNALEQINPVTNVISHTYTWIIDKLTLQIKQLSWFSPEGYAILALTNRLPSAKLYFNEGKLENTRFAIIDALLQGNPWPKAQQDIWRNAMKKYYKSKSDENIRNLLDLASAYDQENKLVLDVDSALTRSVASASPVLRHSIRYGGRGLTLVSALNLLAEQPHIGDFSAEQFIDIIKTMTKEGLFRERKKLTLEFLIQTML